MNASTHNYMNAKTDKNLIPRRSYKRPLKDTSKKYRYAEIQNEEEWKYSGGNYIDAT